MRDMESKSETDDRRSTHKQFEDLPVWQAGRELVKKIYEVTRRAPFCNDRGLCDQIQRAVVSITSNVAEGHERGTTADLLQFLYYAKGSAGEVRSQLYNAEDVGYLAHAEAEALRASAKGISVQLFHWIESMQTPGFKRGPKYHREPDRSMDQLLTKIGMRKGPDGRMYTNAEWQQRFGEQRTE